MAQVVWSDQQQAVFDWVERGTGSLVLEAVAGAGKTTTLVEAVRRMPGTAFLGAFNKKMADELKSRIAGIPDKQAGTFHSAGFGALRRAAGKDVRLEVDDKKVARIVSVMLDAPDARAAGWDRDWERAVVELVGLAKQAGFLTRCVPEPRRSDWGDLITRFDVMDKLPEDANPNRVMEFALRALVASNEDRLTIDYDDMVYLPLQRNLRMFQNDWVLIDEAQDTNATRRALARRMLKPRGRLVAVGDPHQAIFGFTGADGDSLDLIRAAFAAETLRLSVTYRCPKAVVEVANRYVSHIRAAPTAPEGEHSSLSYDEMRRFVRPGDAILCRLNAPLVQLCFGLIRQGTPAKIEGRSIGEGLAQLAGRWRVQTTEALRRKLEKHLESERGKHGSQGTKPDEQKLARVEDQIATMNCLIERGIEQKITTVGGLQEMIRSMFDDVGSSKSLVVLSSVHRSKGLEWPRVFVLGRGEIMPHPMAKQDWAKAQEVNLCYVAVTRAQEHLFDVPLPASDTPSKQK